MTGLVEEAAKLQAFLEREGYEFFFIGGLVVQVWGRPRLTQDIDLTVFTNLTNEEEFVNKFLTRFDPKFHDADQFALTNRVLPMFAKNGIGIDLTLGGISAVSEPLRRSSYQRFTKEIDLKVCSAEDLIILKAFAARPQDWLDIETILIRQKDLDWDYIDSSIEAVSIYEDLTYRIDQLHNLKKEFYRE
ncbi:MAG: nucleotidyltransferase [Acidobacteria bacterium]|nr:nucleotidyltransferase [Acidobacteriota bacterium]